jgi:hypothetical protein
VHTKSRLINLNVSVKCFAVAQLSNSIFTATPSVSESWNMSFVCASTRCEKKRKRDWSLRTSGDDVSRSFACEVFNVVEVRVPIARTRNRSIRHVVWSTLRVIQIDKVMSSPSVLSDGEKSQLSLPRELLLLSKRY